MAALSRNEGFGLTVLEAMASGCAVVASDAGAWSDIIRREFGRLVPKNDLDLTVDALEELIRLPSGKLDTMGVKARAEIERNYTVEQEAQQLVDFYRSLQSQAR